MYVKKIKRVCGVRGCKNTDVFALSKTKEMGNSVIMCKQCMEDALKSVDGYKEPVKVKKERTALFYHPELEVAVSSVAVDTPEPKEVIDASTEDSSILAAEDAVTQEEIITTAPKKKANKKK